MFKIYEHWQDAPSIENLVLVILDVIPATELHFLMKKHQTTVVMTVDKFVEEFTVYYADDYIKDTNEYSDLLNNIWTKAINNYYCYIDVPEEMNINLKLARTLGG